MKQSCLTCRHWRVPTEINADGVRVLGWWARQGYGECAKEGVGHWKPRGHVCGDFQTADAVEKVKREQAFAKLRRKSTLGG
ncbi:hypothetical protein [Bergeriella denitrificans]|uniref:hypothetical protein n=1 Tax=Bergeriella denitrificans TaxID=494 RepID=UPI000826FFC1|nr:hypothetical protein [Bergeriella denitrificans]